ncbi:MAG: ABC transporter ATP-binding protein [Eubacterium sp.]|nr:ABC transporter ATP-binding protein [Eubacterium sp.]
MQTILHTENLCKYYGKNENMIKAVDHTNITVEQGEFIAVVGKSGSGKSTLLHLLGGLDSPTEGKVIIGGKDIFSLKEEQLATFRRRKIGFVFQSFNLITSINVWENIVLPLGLDGRKADIPFLEDILRVLNLKDKRNSMPNTLSGGQQQRVAIARALAAKPDIILADEPTGNLDSKTSLEVMSLLKTSVKKYGQTLMMITHDEELAQMADRILLIEDGRVISDSGKAVS